LGIVLSVCNCWFRNMFTLPPLLVFTDFGTCSCKCFLSNCTPVSLHMLKCSCAHTLYHVFLCNFLFPVLGMLLLCGLLSRKIIGKVCTCCLSLCSIFLSHYYHHHRFRIVIIIIIIIINIIIIIFTDCRKLWSRIVVSFIDHSFDTKFHDNQFKGVKLKQEDTGAITHTHTHTHTHTPHAHTNTHHTHTHHTHAYARTHMRARTHTL